jgi:hypothetical protein
MEGKLKRQDVFETLEEYDVHLEDNVILIMCKMGYKCLRSISNIDRDLAILETFVRNFFGNEDYYNKITKNEKIAMFGEYFANKPQDFLFLPGQRDSIISAVEVSKLLLAKYEESYTFEKSRKNSEKSKQKTKVSPQQKSVPSLVGSEVIKKSKTFN